MSAIHKKSPLKAKDKKTIQKIEKASRIAVNSLNLAKSMSLSGVRASFIDKELAKYIISQGATPANYEIENYGYATSISCASEIAHGIPRRSKLLKFSDVVCVDIGINYENAYADFATTFVIGGFENADKETQKLIKTCNNALLSSIKKLAPSVMLSEYGKNVNKIVSENGFSTIKFLTGHGIGYEYHEEPYVYNFYHPENDIALKEDMIFAFELMITNGSDRYKYHEDGWTLCTTDGSIAVHFEYTVQITKNGCKILGSL